MRINQHVNYLGTYWIYLGEENKGISLRSVNKNIDDITVSLKYSKAIKPIKAA